MGRMENAETNNLKHYIREIMELIFSLSNSQRQISLTALDLQALALGKKHQIEKAIDNVDDLDDLIGKLIRRLEKLIDCYAAWDNPVEYSSDNEWDEIRQNQD
jgi:methyl-accepting chemotaxis protein